MELEKQPSTEGETDLVWTVWRQDFYGNQFRMPFSPDDETEAEKICKEYTDKGHHQTYFSRHINPDDRSGYIPAAD